MRTTKEIAAWRKAHPEERLNLSGADLSGADLSGADLSRADLYGANLYGANLYGADLYGANLSRATGVLLAYEDGYIVYGIRFDDGPRIAAGCRWFTAAEALAHWTDEHPGGARHAKRARAAVRAICIQAEAHDWPLCEAGAALAADDASMARKNAALRGQITKLKKRLEAKCVSVDRFAAFPFDTEGK